MKLQILGTIVTWVLGRSALQDPAKEALRQKPSEVIAYLWQEKKPGQKVAFAVVRGGQRQNVTLDLP